MKISASLAPMAGFTDSPFRRICSRFGASYTVSEMISSVALTMNDRKTGTLASITGGEAPVILQIFGHDPKTMAKAAEILLSGSFGGCCYAAPPAGIDINMGCPMKKIVTPGDGSALMRNLPLAGQITAAVKEVCVKYSVPLSVKIRSGWNSESVNAPDAALVLARNGADRITVHARTREQMYAPYADYTVIKNVADVLKSEFPKVILVGNGDVDSRIKAEELLEYGCDEVSVGRAALGNPWIFSEIADDGFVPPSKEEIISLVIEFVNAVCSEKGEYSGIRESRGRAAYFIRGMQGAAKVRDTLNHCETLEEFENTVRGLL